MAGGRTIDKRGHDAIHGIMKSAQRQGTTIWGIALALLLMATTLWWVFGPGPIGEARRDRADKSAYARWTARPPAAARPALEAYLRAEGVAGLVPMEQLLRSDVRWRKCKGQPFTVPPRALWPHIVPTLRVLRDDVIPAIGAVRVVSSYRSAADNPCLGGAKASRHLGFAALDMEPVAPLSRIELVRRLCALHARHGSAKAIGLGIYHARRFHIDTDGYRRWGHDYHTATSPCLAAVHKIR
ncbi:MAG: hypothetical protein RLZZ58_1400 [Pseudomonadota bacterium]